MKGAVKNLWLFREVILYIKVIVVFAVLQCEDLVEVGDVDVPLVAVVGLLQGERVHLTAVQLLQLLEELHDVLRQVRRGEVEVELLVLHD